MNYKNIKSAILGDGNQDSKMAGGLQGGLIEIFLPGGSSWSEGCDQIAVGAQ